ncbi:hypothetical protein [Chryseobacterium aureum]|uniref:hypothetical protein n=1 Tax=Chryseobacterium aureum TaxID=2497456 RepID=UPI000F873BA5|nr:hypothetical protein [Chryseobacterium aureum]
METEITLYKSRQRKPGHVTSIFFLFISLALLAALCEVIYILLTGRNFFNFLISIIILVFLSVFFYSSVKIFIRCLKEQNEPEEDVVEILSITKTGIFNHKTKQQLIWDEISEIQIIDGVISVTVDFYPEKDFQLHLGDTDVYTDMTREDFAKLLQDHYKKEIYTYNSPSSCGCGG